MVLNERFKGDAFRLAAVLYADNNYEVQPKTIQRKIIESLYLVNNNQFLSVDEIIEQIEEKYDFIFSEVEIDEIVRSHLEIHFLQSSKQSERLICLQQPRFQKLHDKIDHKNIDYFIDQFLNLNHEEDIDKTEGKKTIYRFLYEGFISNVNSFNKMLDVNFDVTEFLENLNYKFNNKESLLVNNFLKWDNDDKNKAIFDISNFALEYCLITNKKSDSAFHLNNLKRKNFYLDTNVIFRAIGINGATRRRRTLTFLDKFIEVEERLVLTKYTDLEFRNTIDYYLKELEKSKSPRVNSKVFLEFCNNSDFYTYYHKWKAPRSNYNLDLFKASIMDSYEALKRKYKFDELKKVPYNESSEIYSEDINELTEEIYSSKRYWALNPGKINYESIVIDAKNIYLIDKHRGDLTKDLFQTKHFLISTDQLLKKWDLERDNNTPTVILPSHWLTILLRYHSRTKDDFKSFVSFLSLSHGESTISNKNLNSVLQGIGEITTDINEQSTIVKHLISQKFQDVIKEDTSPEAIVDNAKEYTKSKLEKTVEELTETTKTLHSKLESNTNELKTLKEANDKDNQLINTYETELLNKKVRKYRRDGIYYLLILVFSVSFLFLIFFFKNKEWNVVSELVQWTNSLEDSSTEKVISQALIHIIPFGLVGISLKQLNKRWFNKENINDKKKTYLKEIQTKELDQ